MTSVRSRFAAPAISALLAGGLAAILIGGVTGAAGATTKTPKALLAASLAAARKQSSVHYVAASTVGTRAITITANAGKKTGTQTVTVRVDKKTGHVTGRYTGSTVYFRGDTTGLEVYLGMPDSIAPTYAGRWISFTSADDGYSSIAASFTVKDAVSQISVSAPVTAGSTATVGGAATVGVRGTTTSLSSKGKHGQATLAIAAQGAPLPVRYSGTGHQKKQKETGQVLFSKWGLKVAPKAPAKSVAASSISAPTS